MNTSGGHSFLQPVRRFLRNTLIRQRLYTPCCASCGEITIPLENRLCVSLPTAMAVDAVLIPAETEGGSAHAFARSVSGLQKYLPWLRQVFIVLERDAAPEFFPVPENLRFIHVQAFSAAGFDVAHTAHGLSGMSEQYLLVTTEFMPERAMLPSDFFTPNGIPFLLLETPDVKPERLSVVSSLLSG